jgi:hypothetical protein
VAVPAPWRPHARTADSGRALGERCRRLAYRGLGTSLESPIHDCERRRTRHTAAERARVATETEFNGIGGLPIYIRIVPVRGTFRTGERTFQCKRLLPLPPLWAQ